MTNSSTADNDTGSRLRRASRGDVVVYYDGASNRASHDHATTHELARRLAALKGYRFAGDYDANVQRSDALYFVPVDTLIGLDRAQSLGIADEHDLFGGVVPYPFVATKCISHALVDDDAFPPTGWSEDFTRRVRPAVLPGFAAFTVEDALRALPPLLAHGHVRIKRSLGIGGFGQVVVNDREGAEQALAHTDRDEIARYGISLEHDLENVTTLSVGQVRVDDLVATYCGTQRLTENNAGAMVYGGSDLFVVRGDFDVLLALAPDPAARHAIRQARRYDEAAFECFDGLFASRRNYDVAQGVDAQGNACSGVLEQSWRIGGASAAEIAALAAFRANPDLAAVRASSREIYGPDVALPAGALVHYRGEDERVGALTKYTTIDIHERNEAT
jgi:hypothetical protein